MTDWVRLWHDMPTDPKWRTIARKSGQRVGDVIAVFTFLMVNASGNALERGTLDGIDIEDVATALDLDDSASVQAILDAMQGKVLDGDKLAGWEKRQPKREDGTAAQRKAAWKERQQNAPERIGTHGNAPETETETDITPLTPRAGGKRSKSRIPDDWELPAIADLPPKAKACAEMWSAASYETHGGAFVGYWRGRQGMNADWRLTWANRVVAIHGQVMRDQKFGNAPTEASNPARPLSRDAVDELSRKRVALAELDARWERGEFDSRADFLREQDAVRAERPEKPRITSTGPPRPVGELVRMVADRAGVG